MKIAGLNFTLRKNGNCSLCISYCLERFSDKGHTAIGPCGSSGYLRKINPIDIGNLSSGADMALHEAFYDFTHKPFFPESVLFSSRDYDRRSITGDLMEDVLVKNKLDPYVGTLVNKYADNI